jgi:alkylmercury lyase
MNPPSIADLKAAWSPRDYSTHKLRRAGIDLLANGEPVTAATLAEVAGVSVDQASNHIAEARRTGVEVEDGAIVGSALTLRPTAHRFRVRGNDMYTWCGFDALFLPIILGQRAAVASTCPVTGAEIRLTVEPDGTVTAVEPSGVVVGIVGEEVLSCCAVSGPESEICSQMPFFASREAGERWQRDHPAVAIVELDDAREVAHAYVSGASREARERRT